MLERVLSAGTFISPVQIEQPYGDRRRVGHPLEIAVRRLEVVQIAQPVVGVLVRSVTYTTVPYASPRCLSNVD